MSERVFVHLDHLIQREDIHYTHTGMARVAERAVKKDDIIRFVDIQEGRGIYPRLRKPDFQRQTNAWTPEKCVEFLDSLLRGWLIPHIILWQKPGTDIRYILDGAHRISVVRAWMEDDWGDSQYARKHYAQHDMDRILEAAQVTRNLVNKQIGEFRKFRDEMEELRELSEMHIHQLRREKRLLFDLFTTIEDTGLPIHWAENNSYEDVAQSFVRINRGGQPLDEFEVHLIEHRKSAFVRSIMAIAGSGKGNYWPNTQELAPESRDLVNKVPQLAQSIHQRLFEPEYTTPPSDVNQPFMPVPPYFRKHLYLREVLPMLSNNEIIRGKNDFIRLVLRPEYTATPDMVVRGGYTILKTAEEKLKHISAISNREPLSLDIVPIFYWYNRRGQLVRSLCYGFLLWMMSGSDDDIRRRKLIFSGNRDRFEDVLHVLKPQIASIHFSGGAALNTAAKTAEFFQQLLLLLNAERSFEGDRLLDSARRLISTIAPIEPEETIAAVSHRRSARNTSIDTHSKINRLFAANMRCHICGGHIDLKRSHQMDHITPYATKQVTTPDGISPTHQFCNNNRSAIENYKQQNIPLSLPQLHTQRGQTPIQGMFDIEQDYWSDEEEFLPVDNENEN